MRPVFFSSIESNGRFRILGGLAALAFLAGLLVVIYRPSFTGGYYVDSKTYLRDSHFFQGGLHLGEAVGRILAQGYNPAGKRILTNVSFALQTYRAGPRADRLRLVNVLIHALNTGLLVLLLGSLTGLLKPGWSNGRRVVAAWTAALAWSLNPFQLETVAYMIQRYVLMETTFFLLAAYLFLKMDLAGAKEKRIIKWATLSLILSAAVLSKETALLFPVTMGAIVIFLQPLREAAARHRAFIAGMASSALIMIAAMLLAEGGKVPLVRGLSESPFNHRERMLTETRVVLHQLSLFLAPLPGRLTITPFYQTSRGLWSPPSTLSALVVLLLLAAAAYYWRERFPALGMALIWYFTGHLMESTFLLLDIAFPHRSYLPTALVFLPIVLAVMGDKPRSRVWNIVSSLLIAAILASFGFISHSRARVWGNEEGFWLKNIEVSPRSIRPYISLAAYYLEKKRPTEALRIMDDGLKNISPSDEYPYGVASLQVNRGIALGQIGRPEEALQAIRDAVKIIPKDMDFNYNLAIFLRKTGRIMEAERTLRLIVQSDESYPDAQFQLAMLLEARGDYAQALRLLEREIAFFPGNTDARQARARIAAKAARRPYQGLRQTPMR